MTGNTQTPPPPASPYRKGEIICMIIIIAVMLAVFGAQIIADNRKQKDTARIENQRRWDWEQRQQSEQLMHQKNGEAWHKFVNPSFVKPSREDLLRGEREWADYNERLSVYTNCTLIPANRTLPLNNCGFPPDRPLSPRPQGLHPLPFVAFPR